MLNHEKYIVAAVEPNFLKDAIGRGIAILSHLHLYPLDPDNKEPDQIDLTNYRKLLQTQINTL